MLGRSIYEETKRDIKDHADVYTQQLKEEFAAQLALHQAIARAMLISNHYHTAIAQTVYGRLHEIGRNAVDYYADDLSDEEKEQIVLFAMDGLVHNKYHGLTLTQRLRQSKLNLRHNIRRSSSVGVKLETKLSNIARVFSDTYPFGAQRNWDTRLFLAEAVRLEHDVAKYVAAKKAYKLVRWTLSDSHSQPDLCDQLAHAVVLEVQHYIEEMNYDTDPHGLYFIHDVPAIPHPNCQCVLKYVFKTKTGKKKKPQKKLNLIQRIIKAIFK